MAKQIIPDRVCPHCGGTEWDVRVRARNKAGNPRIEYQCSLQRLEAGRLWVKKNQVTIKSRLKERYNEDPEKWRADWRRRSSISRAKPENKKRRKIYFDRYRKTAHGKSIIHGRDAKRREALTDPIVRGLIQTMVGPGILKASDITPQMIQQYRQHLKIQRLCRQLKLSTKSTGSNQIPECLRSTVMSTIASL